METASLLREWRLWLDKSPLFLAASLSGPEESFPLKSTCATFWTPDTVCSCVAVKKNRHWKINYSDLALYLSSFTVYGAGGRALALHFVCIHVCMYVHVFIYFYPIFELFYCLCPLPTVFLPVISQQVVPFCSSFHWLQCHCSTKRKSHIYPRVPSSFHCISGEL